MKRIISLLIASILIIVSLPLPAFAASSGVSELHVEGRYIYNAKGEKVRLTGANIPDLQWATGGDGDIDERIDMLCDQWNANVVRLAVHSKFWFGEEWYQNGDYNGYRKKVDDIIKKINAKGKYVILNLHEFYIFTEKNKGFWEDAARVYGNNPGVIFGLLNEPHDVSWDVWRNGGYIDTKDEYGRPYKMKVYGHQQILDMIRSEGAKNVCIAGGLDWAYYFTGLTKGYDGLENGYRLQEPDGALKGNGIIYDTHIYPMKPEYNPVEKAIGNMIDEVPILVGEYGHWGERLFDWYDNYLMEYPYIWMNQMQDFIDRNELNYAFWSFHNGAAPAMLTNLDTYEPTLHSGYYQKFFMLQNPDTRPPESERLVDPSPLSTWEKKIDFDNTDMNFKVYGDSLQAQKTDKGYEGNGLFVNFDIKAGEEGKSAAIAEFPEGTDLSGAKWLSVRVKGDGDQRNLGFGFELSDGRQFTVSEPIDLFENWKQLFLPLGTFHGPDGLLDTTKIKSFFVTSMDEGAGSFTIDDITVGGLPYEEIAPFKVSAQTKGEAIKWTAWEDNESKLRDSFTSTIASGEGKVTTNPVKFYYDRPEGSYGGQARGAIPSSWNLKDAEYITFWAKGDGSDQKFTLRFELEKGTNMKEQRSNFKKREFERFCVDFEVKGSEWKQYKIRFSDLGMSDILHKDRIRFVSLFNRIPNKKGSVVIDDFSFTNVGDELKDSYSYHETPRDSAPIAEVKTKFPTNEILQFPKTFTVTAGKDDYIQIHLMNKTDKDASGELKIEGLPIDNVPNAKYETFAHYVSYPHYPWRSYSLTNFKVNIPNEKIGTYTITVSDASGNGVQPQQYQLIVKPAAK